MANEKFEEQLWKTAIKLRGSVEPAEYKHVVLSLIFLKYASDKFFQQREKLINEGKEKFLEMSAFYQKDNVFYIPEDSRWDYIMDNAKQNDIALKIDAALRNIEKENKSLKGALPDNYYSRLDLNTRDLSSLLDEINKLEIRDDEEDYIGRVYEYFLSQFAIKEGKGKGEFYTPKTVVMLLTELIEPYEGKIYDPCCGSCGMFVQSLKFVEEHNGNQKNISIYGQEKISTTRKLAMMNLAIRGISYNLGEKAADTFHNDLHKDLKADYIMANPPFNQKEWRNENELIDDYRWGGYEVPPESNANYGWILHMVSKLSEDGIAGFLLANGSLDTNGKEEYKIRKQLIENDLVEAIIILPRKLFYSTDISVSLWILNKNKSKQLIERKDSQIEYRDRKGEVLFLDLRRLGSPYKKKYVELIEDDRKKVVNTFKNWRIGKDYEDIPEFSYSASKDEIESKEFSLVVSNYVEYLNKDEDIDFDEYMGILKDELKDLLLEEKESTEKLLNMLEGMGHEIKL